MAKSRIPRPLSGRPLQGVLKKPIRRPNDLAVALYTYNVPTAIRRQVQAEIENDIREQRFARIRALAEHYRVSLIEENSVLLLLLKLAEDFVIGFTEGHRRGPGRGRGSTKGNVFELYRAVENLKRRHTTLGACTVLSKQRGKEWSGKPPRALAAQYNRHRRFIAQLKSRGALFEKIRQLTAPYKRVNSRTT